MKIKRSSLNRTTSMYCAKSGFMCTDCGLKCLSHRGVKRHYKSLRDMENCFFLPGCGLSGSSCVAKSFVNGLYTCTIYGKKVIQHKECKALKQVINSQDGFKTWFNVCKRGIGRVNCPELLNYKC